MSKDIEAIRRSAGPLNPMPTSMGSAHADAGTEGRATLAKVISRPQAGPAGRPPVKRSRPEVISLSVLATAMLALAVVLVAHMVSGAGSPALAATPAPLAYHAPTDGISGRAVLLRLTAVASRQPIPPAPGRYGYVKTAGWYLETQVSGGNASSTIRPSLTESWKAADGSGRTLKRAGFVSPGPQLLGAAAGSITDEFKLRPGPRIFPATLSTDPRVLARELDVGHPTSIGPVERFVAVTDLALDRPGPSRLDSAVLRVLADSPGLVDSGSVIDRAGRPGVAVSLLDRPYAHGGYQTRYTLIFDPTTGRLLGEEETLVAGAGKLDVRIPAVISYTAFLSSGQVSTTTSRP